MIDVDLDLPLGRHDLRVRVTLAGTVTAIFGPSGAGKTSLLEAIAGLRPSARGRIAIDGEALLDGRRGIRVAPERRRVGWVPQDGALFPHLNVAENIRFGLAKGPERAFDDAIRTLELTHLLARHPATLSGGERQRVALARALVTAPRLLLLDEPLASLDVGLKERIIPYLLRIRAEASLPMLYVTHDVGEAMALADDALLLRDGRVVGHGPVADTLLARPIIDLLPDARFDNVVEGELRDGRLLLAGGGSLSVSGSGVGRAAFAVAAEDVLLSTHALDGVSARNVFSGEIARVDALGPVGSRGDDALVVVRALGVDWRAKVTSAAVRALDLAPARTVWLVVKTHALRRLA